MSDVAFAGVVRQAEMVRRGDITPTELVELYLDRIERLDPELNSYRVVLGDRARADAKRVEERLANGERRAACRSRASRSRSRTPRTSRARSPAGAPSAFDEPAAADGEMVRRLREAGAVVIGKTNLPELAICGFTETEAWGITRNPWDTGNTPGGSSGGSGAALARGPLRHARRRPTAPARSASRPRSAGSSG